MGLSGDAGFTLVELLVVVLIIFLVSILTLPTVVSSFRHRQVNEGARLLQAGLAGARDSAIHSGRPAGIRLVPDPQFTPSRFPDGRLDPTQPLAYNRIIPIEVPPDYSTGKVSIYPLSLYTSLPGVDVRNGEQVLVIEEERAGGLNERTNWAWNIRIGDRMNVGNHEYTVVGPTFKGPGQGNVEQFVNYDPVNRPVRAGLRVDWDYLYLVNGVDDDKNGFVDDGHDGLISP